MQNMRKQLHEDALRQRAEFQEMQAENPGQRVVLIRDNDSVFSACAADEAAAGIKVEPLPTKRAMLQPLDYAHHPQITKKLKTQEEPENIAGGQLAAAAAADSKDSDAKNIQLR